MMNAAMCTTDNNSALSTYLSLYSMIYDETTVTESWLAGVHSNSTDVMETGVTLSKAGGMGGPGNQNTIYCIY